MTVQVPPGWGSELTVPIDEPVFLVEIWTPASTWLATNPAWQCEETGLSQCDVHEAIAWACEHTPSDGRYTLHACYIDEHHNGVMVWLAGHDPVDKEQGNRITFTWRTE